MRNRLLHLCGRLACRHPRIIIAVSLVLAIAGAIYSSVALRINARTDDLIAPERPYMQDYRRFVHEFGDPEGMLVVVAHDGDPTSARRCVDVLVDKLSRVKDIESVHGYVSTHEKLRIATRKMDIGDLEGIVDARAALPVILTGDPTAIANDATAGLKRLLRAGAVMSERRKREVGAAAILQVRTLVAAHSSQEWSESFANWNPDTSERTYFTSDTEKLLFVRLMPAKDFGSMAVIEEPLRQTRGVLEVVQRDFPSLEIGLTGKVVLQADEMATTDRDMTRSSIVALIFVALLFAAVLGGFRGPGLAVGSLLVAIAWNFGITTLIIGQLNMLSMIFTLIQVGVGIDFGVHVLARFREERRELSATEAIQATLQTAGRGNLTGALTSAAAFFMARFSHFEGLRELGFVAGSGLLLSFVAMTILLPALLLVFGAGSPRKRAQEEFFIFRPFGTKRPGRALLVALVATILLLPGLAFTRFEENVLELQAEGLSSVQWEHRIIEESDSASWFGVIAVDSIDAIPPLTQRAREHEPIGSIHSVLDVIKIPTKRRQELRERLTSTAAQAPATERISSATMAGISRQVGRLSQLARDEAPDHADDLSALATDVNQLALALNDPRTRPSTARALELSVAGYASGIRSMLEGNEESNLREVLPAGVRQLLLSPGGQFLVMLHPKHNPWDINNLNEFVGELRSVSPDATGSPVTHLLATRDMREGFLIAAALAMLCVIVLVWLDFRSLRLALIAVFPLTIGTFWTVSLMGFTGVHFNLANFFSIPILIGIGVDSGIHILHRYREGGSERFSLGATRRGVLLTSLTSLIGFGCLAGAGHRGLMSLGKVMLIGCSACLIASLLVLPALLSFLEQRKKGADAS